jgi:hypothetical protein
MSKISDRLVKDRKIYGNWQVQSPEGILMFRCENKKANWYLSRDLADRISENTIRLKFEPQGLGNHNKGYGLTEMQNKCVNCGSEDFLTRHHVVPYCYRKHFPMSLKSHNFHDVLSLCVDCHDTYERKADELKSSLADKYDAPVNGVLNKRGDLRILKYATTILKGANGIPQFRVEQMSQSIKEHLGKDWTIMDLEELAAIKQQVVSETHGELVMRKITDLRDFIQTWRKHFVENNSLKYLPSNWKVENNIITNEY